MNYELKNLEKQSVESSKVKVDNITALNKKLTAKEYTVQDIKHFYGIDNVELLEEDQSDFEIIANKLTLLSEMNFEKYLDNLEKKVDLGGVERCSDILLGSAFPIVCSEFGFNYNDEWLTYKSINKIKEVLNDMELREHKEIILDGVSYKEGSYVCIKDDEGKITSKSIYRINNNNIILIDTRRSDFTELTFEQLKEHLFDVNELLKADFDSMDYIQLRDIVINLSRIGDNSIRIKQFRHCFDYLKKYIKKWQKILMDKETQSIIENRFADKIIERLNKDVTKDSIRSIVKEKCSSMSGGTYSSSICGFYSIGFYSYSSKGLEIKLKNDEKYIYTIANIVNITLKRFKQNSLMSLFNKNQEDGEVNKEVSTLVDKNEMKVDANNETTLNTKIELIEFKCECNSKKAKFINGQLGFAI